VLNADSSNILAKPHYMLTTMNVHGYIAATAVTMIKIPGCLQI